jgi:hypothetical protein
MIITSKARRLSATLTTLKKAVLGAATKANFKSIKWIRSTLNRTKSRNPSEIPFTQFRMSDWIVYHQLLPQQHLKSKIIT